MTLADLIQQVRREDDVTLETIARRSGLPLSTIGAWAVGTRGSRRPPAPELLVKLAHGLQRSEVTVFEAAGRLHPSRVEADGDGVYIARLFGELTDDDKQLARDMLLAMHRRRVTDSTAG